MTTKSQANAVNAMAAAMSAIALNDPDSALEYLAVAVASLRITELVKPGQLLLAQTVDSEASARAGRIDAPELFVTETNEQRAARLEENVEKATAILDAVAVAAW